MEAYEKSQLNRVEGATFVRACSDLKRIDTVWIKHVAEVAPRDRELYDLLPETRWIVAASA